ncbi:IclR family transcriptional regulator [Scandinavium sp. TWS1a]|uniref:IclR family transcriptional regulator n=1 Tax=Scandinavium tedordense TaxID=2926521 RepID=UPI002165AFA9|nr:IclR family transcriptional regulator [Scandinavium tedordense]MCS2171495.1 IclR family transcriptional regulator [Scandinavium tedordense]
MAQNKPEVELVEDRYRAPALDKGLDILEKLAELEEGLSQAEIAAALERKPNEIYRMLDRLVKRGYVVRTSVDQYQLSLKLFELAHRQSPMRRLVVQSIPHLRTFAEAAQQGCHIALYERGGLTAIAQVDAPGYWGFGIRVGARFALRDSSSGHVLLAFASPQDQQFMLQQSEQTDGILNEAMHKKLAQIREQGYEIMPSLQVEGVYNIAVPLLNSGGQAIAALACPWVKHLDHMNNPSCDAVLQLLFTTAENIRSGGVDA